MCRLHVFFGCYHNLFRLMAKCGVLENLLLKEHTHTFVNTGVYILCLQRLWLCVGLQLVAASVVVYDCALCKLGIAAQGLFTLPALLFLQVS